MSKLLRLPLTFLAVLAALFFLPGVAFGDPPPTAQECAETPELEGCTAEGGDVGTTAPGDVLGGLTGDTETGGAQAALEEIDPLPLPAVPCDALPGIGLPNCGPPNCDALPTDVLPDCDPADPPTCDRLPELPGVPFCQFPDSDCPPPATGVTSAAVTDGECTPPLTCDQFAQLFGFGDDCGDIPLCIPRDQVPAGFPIPVPAPPLCGPGAGGTPPPPAGGGTSKPPTSNPPAAQQNPVYYQNCDDARAKGAAPVYANQPGYRAGLDSDSDGIGCEDDTQLAAAPVSNQPAATGKLAYTGYQLEAQLTIAWTLLMVGSAALILGRRRA
jgi:hypothetical protein